MADERDCSPSTLTVPPMLDGVYVLDRTGRLILEFASHSTVNFLELAPLIGGRGLSELSPSQLVYQEPYAHMAIFVPCASTCPPLAVQIWVQRMVSALEAYFNQKLTRDLLEQNYAAVLQLLGKMVDNGVPMVTEPDILGQMIPQQTNFLPSLLSTQREPRRAGWDHAWRALDSSKYSKEELLVDVTEHLSIAVASASNNKQGFSRGSVVARPVQIMVRGEIRTIARLNDELPECKIEFNVPGSIEPIQPRFHACVNPRSWEDDHQTIRFIPPNGPCTVAAYTAEIQDQGLVFAEMKRDVGPDGECEVRVSTSMDTVARCVAGLSIVIVLPSSVGLIKETQISSGDLDISNPERCKWNFSAETPLGWTGALRLRSYTAEGKTVAPLYCEVTYSVIGRVPSKAKVRSMNVYSALGNPYKGVRYQTITESFVVR